MRKISRWAVPALSVGLALGAFSFGASASVASLSGNWTNVDPQGAITEIMVSSAGGTKVNVDVFGACEPSACNWGSVVGATYSPTVSGNPVTDAVAASAFYQQGFARRYVILRQQGQFLRYEIFSAFEDSSGRNSYISSGTMRRAMRLIHLMPTPLHP